MSQYVAKLMQQLKKPSILDSMKQMASDGNLKKGYIGMPTGKGNYQIK